MLQQQQVAQRDTLTGPVQTPLLLLGGVS